MLVEEVVISSAPADSNDAGNEFEHIVDITLEQPRRFGGRHSEFALLNQHILSVTIRQLFRRNRKYELYLHMLDPLPLRTLAVSWPNTLTCMVFAAAALVVIRQERIPYSTALAAILVIAAGLSLLLALYHSHFRLTFHSLNGRIPLLTLHRGQPKHQEFDLFVSELIRRMGNPSGASGVSDALIDELRAHRRLMKAGIISSQQYACAKLRILSEYR